MKKLISMLVSLAICCGAIFAFTSCVSDSNTNNDDNVLRVGMECAYAPYNWTQNTNADGAVPIYGQKDAYANGYDVKIAQRIADALGKTLEVHKYEWESLIPAVKTGALDLIIAGMSPTDERKEEIDFTSPYYESNIVIVVRKDGAYADADAIADFAGATLVAQAATFHDTLIDQIAGATHATPMDTFPLMVTALNAGTVDGYIAEEPGAISDCNLNSAFTYIHLTNNNNGFTITDMSNVTLAVGIKQGSALTSQINSVLEGITVAERLSLMETAISQAAVLAID